VSRPILSTLVAALAAASFFSCGSPVHDDMVTALGPEPAGEHSGPLHRAGQPCLTCHGSLGPSHTEFAVAGTVYRAIDDMTPVSGAIVTFSTLDNDAVAVQTNAAGNFYVTKSKFPLAYPLHVSISYTGLASDVIMASRIGRDGSCADCHADPANRERFGHIYLVANAADWPK
jgi:hypothetical protein